MAHALFAKSLREPKLKVIIVELCLSARDCQQRRFSGNHHW